MATSAPKRSPYKQRRIEAMMHEATASSPPRQETPPPIEAPVKPTIPVRPPEVPVRPPEQQARPAAKTSELLSFRRFQPKIILLSAAGTLVAAVGLYLGLSHQNRTVEIKLNKPESTTTKQSIPQPLTTATTPPISTTSSPAKSPATAPAVAAPVPVAPTPALNNSTRPNSEKNGIAFKIKHSKIYERVGPVRIRLNRINPKHDSCDLSVTVGGPVYQKQAHLNKPIQLYLPKDGGSINLMVTSIASDSISGSVLQHTP